MFHLRRCILARIISSPSASPIYPLHRLLSAAAAAVSPNPSFSVEEYLVHTCGLTRPQALKASKKISHLKSPSRPDAVLAFLADLGLSRADVNAVVARDPRFLCAKVDETLASNVVRLTGLGLSRSEVASLVSLATFSFRCRSIVSNLPYYLSLFGSYQNLLPLLKSNSYLLSSDFEKKGKPGVAFLRECGLGACDIAKLCIRIPRLLTSKPERLHAMVACAEGLGVPRGSEMFRHVLQAVGFRSEENVAAKVDSLKKTFRWSDAEVAVALSNNPSVMSKSKETLQHKSDFFFSEVGLEPAYIACRPVIINYSLEGRLRPRYHVLKYLKRNGFIDCDRDFYKVATLTEMVFVETYICSHKESAPNLAEDYAAACRGEVPISFRFT